MIFLDANVILRLLTSATSPRAQRMKAYARALFDQIERGEISATTSEVVLHEVAYVLTSPRQYAMPPDQAVHLLTSILRKRGLKFPGDDSSIYLRAVDIWAQHPKLEFSDSVIAARCEAEGYELATFDRHFSRVEGLALWSPDGESATDYCVDLVR